MFALDFESLRDLPRDGRLLMATRMLRLLAYGFLSVILVLYLRQLGMSATAVGWLFSLTLLGDTAVSIWLTTRADRLGRRKMLVAGALLMVFAGVVFALTANPLLLLIAATIGVISPSGNEIGPFLSIEQASLSHVVPDARRTRVFAWYTLAGAAAVAVGSLVGGAGSWLLQHAAGFTALDSYRAMVIAYAAVGVVLAVMFTRLSAAVEVSSPADPPASPFSARAMLGLSHSKNVVLGLSSLFMLDAFAGGFVIQAFAAYWFFQRFGVHEQTLGAIFFGANLLAGLSALVAAPLAKRFGLVNTMVFTHLPSNVLLILVPLMPTAPLAIIVLMLRFSISQMDVPARQSYVMAVVRPEERSAAAGVAGVARSTGAALAQVPVGRLLASPGLLSVPFFIAGGLKIVYDVLVYRAFVAHEAPEERRGFSVEDPRKAGG